MATTIPILLLPSHIKPDPSSLPLLRSIQKVLNDSYTATYCAHPELFGTSHVRMADPAQLMDIIGAEGFTVVLAQITPPTGATSPDADGIPQNPRSVDTPLRECSIVATASVKDFGDGDIETYAQWSKNLGGKQWARKKEESGEGRRDEVEEGNEKDGSEKPSNQPPGRQQGVQKLEVTAFGVSPAHQSGGLGARLLDEIKWLVGRRRLFQGNHAGGGPPYMVEGLNISSSPSSSSANAPSPPLVGIDITKLRSRTEGDAEDGEIPAPRLVLVAIRELGNEAYYQRRGFRTTWSGPVPVGMWDCRKECTMVYMEMEAQGLQR